MRPTTLAVLMLPFSLSALAAPLDAFNGTFDLSGDNRRCEVQVRLNSRGNDVFVVDGQGRVVDQLTVGEVRSGRNNLSVGVLRNSVLTVTNYRTGLLGRRTALDVRSLALNRNTLTFERPAPGRCLFLKVIPRPAGAVGDLPALDRPARTRFISLDESFRSPEELFDAENAEQVIAAANLIKSATPEYHRELLRMARRLETVSLAQAKLLGKLMYFTAADQRAMVARLRELEAAGAQSNERGSEYQVVLRNIQLAVDFASQISYEIGGIVQKLPPLSAADFVSLAAEMPRNFTWIRVNGEQQHRIADGGVDGSIIYNLLQKLPLDLANTDKRVVLNFLRVQAPGQGIELAAAIFRSENESYNAQALITGARALYPESARDLAAALVGTATFDLAGLDALIAFFGDHGQGLQALLVASKNQVVLDKERVLTFSRAGVSLPQFKAAGVSTAILRDAGFPLADFINSGSYTLAELKPHFPLSNFIAVGYDVRTLRGMGYTILELKAAAITLENFINSGAYTLAELKPHFALSEFIRVGYDVRTLRGMGYPIPELKTAGVTLENFINSGAYTLAELKPHFSLREFIRVGYDVRTLRGMGYTIPELKTAGVTLENFINSVAYTLADLKPHFTIRDFIRVGYDARTLKGMGYSVPDIRDAGLALTAIINAGGHTLVELKPHFPISAFIAIGYDARSLRGMGFTLAEIKAGGVSLTNIINSGGFTFAELRTAFSVNDFRGVGYDVQGLRQVGFSVAELRAAGFDDVALFQAGFSRAELGLN